MRVRSTWCLPCTLGWVGLVGSALWLLCFYLVLWVKCIFAVCSETLLERQRERSSWPAPSLWDWHRGMLLRARSANQRFLCGQCTGSLWREQYVLTSVMTSPNTVQSYPKVAVLYKTTWDKAWALNFFLCLKWKEEEVENFLRLRRHVKRMMMDAKHFP